MFTEETIDLTKSCYEALMKLGWNRVDGIDEDTRFVCLYGDDNKIRGYAPLLHWERIEEILEGMEYRICSLDWHLDDMYYCRIRQRNEVGGMYAFAQSKTRQLAVMRATIELAKKENQIAKTKGS